MSKPGSFSWNELVTSDTGKARAFYAKAFGWETSEMPMPNGGVYTLFQRDGATVAGMMDLKDTSAPAGTPSHWFAYIEVEDAEATCRSAAEAGGAVHREPWAVEGVGTIAILAGPDGSRFGIVQPESGDGGS